MSYCIQCKGKEISNKFFKLCWFCNKKRLDEAKRNSIKPARSQKSYGAGNRSSKSKRTTVSKVLQKGTFRAQIFGSRPNVCQGCDDGHQRLTISHTIPVSLRKDLEFREDNVQLECMICHTKWEHGTLQAQRTLLNFEDKMNWIKAEDPEYFERRFNKE